MCTALTYKKGDFYFGRNLDIEKSYGETVTITPRNFPFYFKNGYVLEKHYSIIGIAAVIDDYPLYYDATNEKGLSVAGLNFPDNAVYYEKDAKKTNITPFELIPWILGICATISEAVSEIEKLNLWNEPFSKELPLSPLHWLIADKTRAITLESLKDGIKIYDNPIGVLTNNPPFDFHIYNLSNYINLTSSHPSNRFSKYLNLKPYSLGMGAIGLAGDLSSASRFVRAAYTKFNCVSHTEESVARFFHILDSVAQTKGLTLTNDNKYEYTLYSSCCNTNKGIYYYKTYNNNQITAVYMNNVNLEGDSLYSYPLLTSPKILKQPI